MPDAEVNHIYHYDPKYLAAWQSQTLTAPHALAAP